jgi:alkanesulfonate monooxygenase SsuD/methylene tetrahydromethanopterin reductase-like flavin-dependent oxidoreductase (luciferase family)
MQMRQRGSLVKVGTILMYQNVDDHRREKHGEPDAHAGSSQFFREEIALGEYSVSVGFDSIWSVEHHFSSHGESAAPLQELTYFAGRVPDANLGTCVVVLPWNDPVRVAEQIAILDNLIAPDKQLTIGFGRGSAQREYDGFEMALGESTERFKENWEIVKLLLTGENVSYQGKWRSFSNVTTLPRPRTAPDELLSRCYYSWGSRNSLEYAAEAGFMPIFVPKGSAEDYAQDMAKFNSIRADHGLGPVRPIVSLCLYVDTDEARAKEQGRTFLRRFYATTLDHYDRLDASHFIAAGNYQEQAEKAAKLAQRDLNEALDEMVNLQLFGTPDQVLEQLRHWRDVTDPDQFLFTMRFGGMSYEEGRRNTEVIARTILPEMSTW